ncbi:hypothetical protein HMPREF1146_2321 [Prevotella sp. MSX73]|nr:hypothetical protein HMPREF1146_2321 [Prevotella sp. MSX73]
MPDGHFLLSESSWEGAQMWKSVHPCRAFCLVRTKNALDGIQH